MNTFELADQEFGTIVVRCNPRARRVILRVKHNGTVHITLPHKRHLPIAQRLVEDSRSHIRKQREELQQKMLVYAPGAMIGRGHQLVFKASSDPSVTTRVSDSLITIKHPFSLSPQDERVQQKVHIAVKKALRRQASEFLPRQLAKLAQLWGFNYKEMRLTSSQTRWGSCSSDNTISLNIALMTLPDDLVNYVICHELCHTVEHNHGERFWALVTQFTPEWRILRKTLRQEHPV